MLASNARSYVTRDSGARDEFDTGARRDTQDGKPRYDLIPVEPLRRLAALMQRGADKYDDDNWRRGMPMRRFEASMMRHVFAYMDGDDEEDHLAAVVFNAFAIMNQEREVAEGRLPAELDDRPTRPY